jgi:hypothetical protein
MFLSKYCDRLRKVLEVVKIRSVYVFAKKYASGNEKEVDSSN